MCLIKHIIDIYPIGVYSIKMRWIVGLVILSAFFALPGWAHLVIYKDGWVYWGQFSPDSNIQRVSYTFHPRFSLEASREFYRGLEDYRDAKLGPNILVKRWLFPDSQGNIYASLHAGSYQQENGKGKVFRSGLMADWESRKLYTALSISNFAFDDDKAQKLSYRFGFAPYVAGMQMLQTWMIFQLSYFKEIEDKVKITPMMRFFYNNTLWEMGADLHGKFFLTLMVHY